MTVFALVNDGGEAPRLAEDLAEVGIAVVARSECINFVQDVIQSAPDLVMITDGAPEAALFESIVALQAAAPRPVVMFTTDPDADKIGLATRSGVHAYVVNGYHPRRLRSVIHLAQARFSHEQLLREELAQVTLRFAERKLLDRAKGILMGARGLREEEAYQALRRAAMHSKQRIGQIARQVIETSRYAEAINRAGQLRMLSQRMVKLYALGCAEVRREETAGLFADSLGHVDSNLAILGQALSKATFGDLLEAVLKPWQTLRTALAQPAVPGRLREIDRLAEALLARSEQLTANLEVAGFAAALHVVNVAGRQRMLSQRLAKAVLMRSLLRGKEADAAQRVIETTQTELVDGFAYLRGLTLSNGEIIRELDEALLRWAEFQAAMAISDTAPGRDAIARLSETLLDHFDRVTEQFERGVKALTGEGATGPGVG